MGHFIALGLSLLLAASPQEDAGRARELEARASQLQRAGKYHEAEQPLLEAIALWKRLGGPEHIEVLNDEMNLAVSYRRRGDARKAIPLLSRVVASLGKSKDPDAPELHRKALNNLAAAYKAEQRYDEARVTLERCLSLLEATGPSVERARVLDNLASILLDAGKVDAAEPYARRGYSEWRAVRGEQDVDVAISMSVLGGVRMRQKKYAEARTLLEDSLRMNEALRGKDHVELGATLNLLGELETRAGRLDAAQQHYERTLALSERALTAEHPYVKDAREGLATVARLRAARK
ncbi:tetratricopeptide repeat protein [Pyxidicoccus fallax]|uniref:Tetratricopeptide repeat protein n=1 Tax=Pyxidicoccus fallax TaxID=394095 RepID=A0A848M0U8_9BACT|nr:tetratricopeptide repeat protein [Pyxidicoccus fallax]NMO23004.1 tetratricopeptide repeat protein [Pyxidicoccus fallax]NPC85563.1 tetratricopeptide repeat protein [Pyxidicoccus fallax]